LLQNRCLALASLMFISLSAAHAAPLQVTEAGLDPAPILNIPAPPAVNLASADLPDDPSAPPEQSQTNQSQPQAAPPAQNPADPGQLSSEDQLRLQEHQRVLGVMAAFNTTRNRNALPLTPGQKFQLFFKSQTDPWPFGLAAVIAGFDQATDSPAEYGQGMQGYAKRFGATYTDAFIGNFWGNAVLTTLWHEDPRYFQKGTGSYASRFLWATTATVWCRRDNGSWGPNYANVAGNLIGAAIANAYYPESERTVGDTITRGLTVTAEGIIGAEVIEFWPDIVRRYQRNHAAKLARQTARQDAQDAQAARKADHQAPAAVPAPAPATTTPQR
jgi:hypothetical protein